VGFLPKLPFFEGFMASEIDEATASGRYLERPRGSVLIAPGSGADSVLLVLRGASEMLRPVPNGCRRVAVLGPGQVLGLPSHLLGATHASWVLARENSLLLEWPAAVFQEMLASDTAVGNRVRRSALRYLAAAISRGNRELARLAFPAGAMA
jgi:CRP-like cAMP-binding protein